MKQSVLMTIGFLVCLSGCSKQPDSRYVAAPDFTEENFSRIQAGMTLHEVLGILGPPLSVFGPILRSQGQRNREYVLEYTGPSSASLLRAGGDKKKQVIHHNYSVRFNASNYVTELHDCESRCEYFSGLEKAIHANENYRRHVGDMTLQALKGPPKVLDANDPGLYLMLLTRGTCSTGGCNLIIVGPSWLQSSMQELLDSGMVRGVCYLYIGDQPAAVADSVGLLDKLPASEVYVQTTPPIELTTRDRDSGILLYKSGVLHSVLPIGFVPDANYQPVPYEVANEIQKWLINKLGAN